MDALLVERFGQSVPPFAEEGEEAFRLAEARLCRNWRASVGWWSATEAAPW
jgi:shikimate kinase